MVSFLCGSHGKLMDVIGNNVIELEKYVFFNSGGENQMLGTRFIVHKELKAIIEEFSPITKIMCYLQ